MKNGSGCDTMIMKDVRVKIMTRKEFYREYYRKTNRYHQRIWNEAAWIGGKGSHTYVEKPDIPVRKYHIVMKYLLIAICWIPYCVYPDYKTLIFGLWLLSVALIHAQAAKFSIIRVELLYSVYRKDTVYCSLLHDIFLNTDIEFIKTLMRMTKKVVSCYSYSYRLGGRGLYGKYIGTCRKSGNKLSLAFHKNKVVVRVNDKKSVINGSFATKEQLVAEVAALINASL